MLFSNLGATRKIIDQQVVLNENHILNAKSLECDIQDAFTTLYEMDPSSAFELSQGHELLQQLVKQLDAVIERIFTKCFAIEIF